MLALHAGELHLAVAGREVAVDHELDFPRLRVDFCILYSRLVLHAIFVQRREALYYVDLIAMEIRGDVVPGPRVLVGYINHQRVAFPVAFGVAGKQVSCGG